MTGPPKAETCRWLVVLDCESELPEDCARRDTKMCISRIAAEAMATENGIRKSVLERHNYELFT